MRELIWLIIAVLFGYVVFQLVRALRIKPEAPVDENNRKVAERPPSATTTPAEGAADGAKDSLAVRDLLVLESTADQGEQAPGIPSGEGFQAMFEVQRMRQEMLRMDAELSEQRSRVSALEASMESLREQLESALAGQGVSPEYNEALVFARRGLDVDAIAERCGISVAEAELVRSLAQRGRQDQEEP